tara:strand:+ start:580 stop:753 length:174 start_codon:yes stop_codon:yes gene_type:complete
MSCCDVREELDVLEVVLLFLTERNFILLGVALEFVFCNHGEDEDEEDGCVDGFLLLF